MAPPKTALPPVFIRPAALGAPPVGAGLCTAILRRAVPPASSFVQASRRRGPAGRHRAAGSDAPTGACSILDVELFRMAPPKTALPPVFIRPAARGAPPVGGGLCTAILRRAAPPASSFAQGIAQRGPAGRHRPAASDAPTGACSILDVELFRMAPPKTALPGLRSELIDGRGPSQRSLNPFFIRAAFRTASNRRIDRHA